jgi:hypothetical protein
LCQGPGRLLLLGLVRHVELCPQLLYLSSCVTNPVKGIDRSIQQRGGVVRQTLD